MAAPLIAEQFEEASSSKGEYPLSINWEVGYNFESVNCLYVCGMFDGTHLIGYVMIFKVPNLFHSMVTTALFQATYIMPEYRGHGLRLIRYAEKVAKALECTEIKISISKRSKSRDGRPLSTLFTLIGYTFKEVVFTKRL